MSMISRPEELKRLLWDNKMSEEVLALCEMVNPSTSAALVQSICNVFEKRLKWAIELKKLEPDVQVFLTRKSDDICGIT